MKIGAKKCSKSSKAMFLLAKTIEIGKMPENGDLSPPEAEHGIVKRLDFFLREIEYG